MRSSGELCQTAGLKSSKVVAVKAVNTERERKMKNASSRNNDTHPSCKSFLPTVDVSTCRGRKEPHRLRQQCLHSAPAALTVRRRVSAQQYRHPEPPPATHKVSHRTFSYLLELVYSTLLPRPSKSGYVVALAVKSIHPSSSYRCFSSTSTRARHTQVTAGPHRETHHHLHSHSHLEAV